MTEEPKGSAERKPEEKAADKQVVSHKEAAEKKAETQQEEKKNVVPDELGEKSETQNIVGTIEGQETKQ